MHRTGPRGTSRPSSPPTSLRANRHRVGLPRPCAGTYGKPVTVVARHLHELPGERFRPGERVIALTFDDGPGPATHSVLDALAELDVPATFFVVGNAAEERRELVVEIAAAGHTVGLHSWSHPRLSELSDAELLAEYGRTADLVSTLIGEPPGFARPTFVPDDAQRGAALLSARNLTWVTWSIDPRDWERPAPEVLTNRVLDALHPGAIILLHDGGRDRSNTVAALPPIVHGAQRAGYRFTAL